MNKLIIRVVQLFILAFTGIALITLGDAGSLGGIFLFVGTIFSRRGKSDDDSTKQPLLPQPYNGLSDDAMTRTEYVDLELTKIDKDILYEKEVERVKRSSKRYWDSINPHFNTIESLIKAKDWSDLVDTYIRIGHSYQNAFTNTFNAIIREEGNEVDEQIFSMHYTIGEFMRYLFDVHDFDEHVQEQSGDMLNSLIELRDKYGVQFNKPAQPNDIPTPLRRVTYDVMEDDEVIEEGETIDISDDDQNDLDEESISQDSESTTPEFDRDDESTWTDEQRLTAEDCSDNNPTCRSC